MEAVSGTVDNMQVQAEVDDILEEQSRHWMTAKGKSQLRNERKKEKEEKEKRQRERETVNKEAEDWRPTLGRGKEEQGSQECSKTPGWQVGNGRPGTVASAGGGSSWEPGRVRRVNKGRATEMATRDWIRRRQMAYRQE